jgi:nicotinate-nucleotide adenylyltransferase
LRQLQLDAVWWVVTPANPLKNRNELAPLQERMKACRQLVADDRRIVVTGFEQKLATNYSISTLVFLRLRNPTTRFVWLMGADNLAAMHHWKSWRELFELLPIAIIDRPGWHLPALSSPAALRYARWRLPPATASVLPFRQPPAWTFLSGPLSDRSSSAIRRQGAANVGQS